MIQCSVDRMRDSGNKCATPPDLLDVRVGGDLLDAA